VTTSPNLDNPFWKFSLAVYGAPGVADECLALQERLSLDVNLLLFAAYAGAVEGSRLESQDVAAAANSVAAWHDEIVRALRQARRALKPFGSEGENPLQATNAALRATVKAAELQAERIEQAMLWDWSRTHIAARPRGDRQAALAANLRTFLAFCGAAAERADPMTVAPRLFDAAMAYEGTARRAPGP
jgi:uncharacterized protein (TIGR02444 family)